jgi:predicted DNA-binding transcriptional regulator YafY
MTETSAEHDTLAFRLAEILLKLNRGDSFTRQELADEFKVGERTIYRDLNRLGGIVDRLSNGRYQLAPEYRGKLNANDLASFAKLTGVDSLFPSSNQKFLLALVDPLIQSSFLVKQHHYEHPKPDDKYFKQLDDAIRQHRVCQLSYSSKPRVLEPYRLINNKGIWYLAATENQQLKAFSFSRISLLTVSEQSFVPKPQVMREIEDEDDIWFSRDKTEVLLTVAPQIAYYFLRRKLLPRQEMVKKTENGGLIISSQISHAGQILPLIRYWIPQVKILEPVWLQEMLENELRNYLQ